MKSSFNELGISPEILEALGTMGFQIPTEVQAEAIPHILANEDLIVISKTGSGKTATFGIPMLQMTDDNITSPQGLILTPTRELAVQVDSDLKLLSKKQKKRTIAVYGQHSMNLEIQALSKGAAIVTGTPGRVYDHIRHGNLNTKDIRFLVLDEADRMLDMGFIEQVERIIKTLPTKRITLLFSATIPYEIRKICREYMKNPVTIEIESQTKTVDTIRQEYYRIDSHEKRTQLNRLLLMEQPDSCMIFCNTRIGVNQIQDFLMRKGYSSQALHGDIPQSKRMKTIQQFKQGEFCFLVATDVAARGIHIEDLSLVINYDVPKDKDSYIHRIGRTGRAGNGGHSITMVTSDDIMSLYEIEEHIGAMIEEKALPTDAELNARKEAAEKWILSKAPKQPVPQNTSAPYRQPHGSSGRPAQSPNRPAQGHGRPQAGGSRPQNAPGTRPPHPPRTPLDAKPQQTPRPPQAPGSQQAPRPQQDPRPQQTVRSQQTISPQLGATPPSITEAPQDVKKSESLLHRFIKKVLKK